MNLRDLERGDDFDRVEILGRLRAIETGGRTSLERGLQREIERKDRVVGDILGAIKPGTIIETDPLIRLLRQI